MGGQGKHTGHWLTSMCRSYVDIDAVRRCLQ